MVAELNSQDSVETLWELMTAASSSPVFLEALPQCTAQALRSMVMLLLPSIATLPISHSLLKLEDHLSRQDPSSLLLLAAQLDRDHLLLSAPHAPLLHRLLSSSCVRVCGVFLNQVSGKLVLV